jgi:hypothetical protein
MIIYSYLTTVHEQPVYHNDSCFQATYQHVISPVQSYLISSMCDIMVKIAKAKTKCVLIITFYKSTENVTICSHSIIVHGQPSDHTVVCFQDIHQGDVSLPYSYHISAMRDTTIKLSKAKK